MGRETTASGRIRAWGALLAVAFSGVATAQAQRVDVEQYLRRDGYEQVKISPDGLHYAATANLADRGGLVILRRSDKKVVGGAMGGKHSLIDDFWWVNNERVVVSPAERLGSRDAPYATGQLYAVGTDGGRAKPLVEAKLEKGIVAVPGLQGWEMVTLIDTLPGNDRQVLVASWNRNPEPITHVETLDVYSGRRARLATAPVRRARFTTDVAGQVRFAHGARQDNTRLLYYRDSDRGEWRLVNDEASSGRIEWPLGFAADGVTAYLQVTQADGPHAVVAWNTRSDERREVQRDATVDPFDAVYAPDGRTLVGMRYMHGAVRTRLFDEATDTARVYRALDRAFPHAAVTLSSFTRDGRLALAQVWNDRTPGETYVFDTKTLTAQGVLINREWFDPAALPAARAVTLQARDGLALHGYYTPPRTPPAQGPAPMVVIPHGGPIGIFDAWSFDDDTHLLSEAGYGVLRINYRGSGNYGQRFAKAAAREWGGRMQDDLTDATRWAIEQALADPARICIYGASYGAYAALMGAAREPGLYRCAVGYVGVYDLAEMHRDNARAARWMGQWSDDWVGERSTLQARSPVHLAERITAPVLLVAGGEDHVTPIDQSHAMERALRRAGKSVETLYVDSEGHGFYAEEHRRTFYTRLLAFLSQHLGGGSAAEAGAAGSGG